MKLKIERFLFFSVLTFFLVGCQTNEGIQERQTDTSVETTNNLTEEEQEAIDNGYPIGKYRMFLSENNKKSTEEMAFFLENNFLEKNVLQIENQVDASKKVNVIVYSMRYSPEDERYTLGVFYVNTSDTNIKKVKLMAKPKFKTLGEEGEFGEIEYEGEDFPDLPTNGIVAKVISANAPISYLEKLKENTGDDITIEIKELEINGEQVENVN
ncbi:hypothetical protein I6N95_26345 [Vagococcus sp. BWB3-3]|uniref:Uncharacterized protein n=1 Tax=Vagococcus allomyrinae TaxID=2794353 RepID=A0A940SXP4_9ENTE|nr:hypothetical protein [Vagococcus allomyrinae]MBP1044535.1 hypothetical protein [Vagococcus allomyrinae]